MLLQAHEIIFRRTADGVLIANPRGLIESINPAAAAMLGVTVDEIIGKSAEQQFRNNAALVNLFSRSGEQTLDVRLPKRRLAVGIATTINGGTRIVILQDVTEKRELESRRDILVSAIAHDLHNPLSALSGFADLVAKVGDLNEQQTKFLHRIRQTTSKLTEVIKPLVDLAWIEAGMPLAHLPIQLGQITDEVVSALAALALDRQLMIAVSIQDPMPVVMGDPERIRMAVYHLIHNAIIYSNPEQTVAVHAWGDNNEIYFTVADQGFGIADDEVEMIFDRMYRSRDERVRETPGGGLGLTITRTIIKRHGGDIWASSNLDSGSVFTFVLPSVRF